MAAAIPRVRAVAVLPLDFVGRLRILRTMHLPGALHVAEASLVSISGLRKLRTAFCQASLSGAVLSLLDGPVCSDPGFYVVWCRFRMLRRYMAYNSSVRELARIYSLLQVVSVGAPGHGPVNCLCLVLYLWGFLGTLTDVFGLGLVCMLFVRSLVPFNSFGKLSVVLGELRLLVTLVRGLVFWVAGIWIFAVL